MIMLCRRRRGLRSDGTSGGDDDGDDGDDGDDEMIMSILHPSLSYEMFTIRYCEYHIIQPIVLISMIMSY